MDRRWIGVWIVTAALLLVGLADIALSVQDDKEAAQELSQLDDDGYSMDAATNEQGQMIAIFLIIGQCITSVLQDITEEIFMSEANFDPMLLLGMEGAIGLVIGILCYLPMSRFLGQDPWEPLNGSLNEMENSGFAIFITLLFLLTAIYNISATAVTSSMTRNLWKNLRTQLVWVFGLVIYFSTGDEDMGEPWGIPSSLIVPMASVIMGVGIWFYYKDK